jgi:succinate dehydrogenase / fumarate reductase, cytochrome b subunit
MRGTERTTVATSAIGVLDRQHFLLRRLHSLSGIVPIGAFLINHLLTNSTAFLGPERFNAHVRWIQDLPWLLAIEILFIFGPLAFHALYGAVIAWQGQLNTFQYRYVDNWRYTLQRVTAWITLVFVVVHLLHFRFAGWLGYPEYKAANPFFDATQHSLLNMWLPAWIWVVFYAVGLTAAAFHFCNGLVTFCITWGITVGVEARKKVSVAAGALCAVLVIWGFASLYALVTVQRQAAGG